MTSKNYVANAWVDSSTGRTFEDENPAPKRSVLGRFQDSGPADVSMAVGAAVAAFPLWSRTDVGDRQACASRFISFLRQSREEIAGIVSRENGKTLSEARAEIDSACAEGEYHIHQVSCLYGHGIPMGTRAYMGWSQYHPLGVAGIITPWNFPVNVICRKAIPAILTGNTVVVKPARFTPWSGVFLSGLFERAGFPAGVFNCLTGAGARIGDSLVDDPRVQAISFTGSTDVGRRIQERAAPQLKRTQLELGGKNALIVMDDADLDLAVSAAMDAGFACAGQWCTSTSRVLVQDGALRALTSRLVDRCEAMHLGDPLDPFTDMGPVAGPEQYQRIGDAIEEAAADGARLVTGGVCTGDLGERGYFVRPTVFTDVDPRMSIFHREIFGPVLALVSFAGLDDALDLANNSSYGLSSALFTRDVATAHRYVDEIEAGLAHVNMNSGFKDPSLPFGGWKQSGFGQPENDRTGLEFFLNRKAVYFRKG